MLRAFVVAGRPGLNTFKRFGRFEAWSDLVRGALVWLGEPDPCETRELIAIDDSEAADLDALLSAMAEHAGNRFMSAGDLIELAQQEEHRGLAEALPYDFDAKALGYFLKSKDGRIVNGRRLQGLFNKHRKTNEYRVVDSPSQ